MALNRRFADADQLNLPVAQGVESGDPVLVGDALPGVALTDRDSAGNATVALKGAFDLPVISEAGDVAPGDILYITSGGTISRASSGGNVRFGYALEPLATNTAGVIAVKVGY